MAVERIDLEEMRELLKMQRQNIEFLREQGAKQNAELVAWIERVERRGVVVEDVAPPVAVEGDGDFVF